MNPDRCMRIFALSVLLMATVEAQQADRLVKDINRDPGFFQAGIDEVTPVAGGVVFRMTTLANGDEPWFSDGTPRGTRLLKDINPGSLGSFPNSFRAAGAHVFFLSRGQLWVTDGTEAGTSMLKEFPGADVTLEATAGGRVVLIAHDREGVERSRILWTSDGTISGTFPLLDEQTEQGTFYSHGFVNLGPWVYFLREDLDEQSSFLWRTDGTPGGTSMQRDLFPPGNTFARKLHAGRDRLLVEGVTDGDWSSLWSVPLDGGPIVNLAPEQDGSWPHPLDVFRAGSDWIFTTPGLQSPPLLWFTDGTPGGTRAIDPVLPSELHYLAPWNDEVAATVPRDGGGYEVWLTDGTVSRTRRIGSFPDSEQAPLVQPGEESEFLWMMVQERNGSWALWRSDGSPASARRVRPLDKESPYFRWSNPVVSTRGLHFFTADYGGPDFALWRLRGKARQAVRLTRPENSTASAFAYESVAPGRGGTEALLLPMVRGFDGGPSRDFELWRTDGSGRGTRAVWIPPVTFGEYGFIHFTGHIHGKTMLWMSDATSAVRQLWATDGTGRGTRLAYDFSGLQGANGIGEFIEVGDTAVAPVFDGSFDGGSSFWRSDGTAEGSGPLVAADGTPLAPRRGEFEVLDGVLYFVNRESDGIHTLWRTDGTTAGTFRVKTFPASQDRPRHLTATGGRLRFFMDRGFASWRWTSDGTNAGTVQTDASYSGWQTAAITLSLDLAGRNLIFYNKKWWAPVPPFGYFTPLEADGEEQTYYAMDDSTRNHAVAGDTLFYTAITDSSGSELWKTDGTKAGTTRVKDINPGPGGSQPTHMLAVGDVVYFAADDGVHGFELWRSDGTEAGTFMLDDIEPGGWSSFPSSLEVIGNKLYFIAQRIDVGRELHVIDLSPRD